MEDDYNWSMSQPVVIGFAGRAGVGKTWAANRLEFLLEEDGIDVYRFSFATPLKNMYLAMHPEVRIPGPNGDPDWAEIKARHPEVRAGLQNLGSAVREHLSIWNESPTTIALRQKVTQVGHHVIIIDDVRFPDEAELIKELRGAAIRIDGCGTLSGSEAEHESETPLRGVIGADSSEQAVRLAYTVVNNLLEEA